MTPDLKTLLDYMAVSWMIGGLLGRLLSGKQDDTEDRIIVEAHDLVMDALSDADRTRTTECITDRNWRDQLSIGQAIELHREMELRKMGKRRN